MGETILGSGRALHCGVAEAQGQLMQYQPHRFPDPKAKCKNKIKVPVGPKFGPMMDSEKVGIYGEPMAIARPI